MFFVYRYVKKPWFSGSELSLNRPATDSRLVIHGIRKFILQKNCSRKTASFSCCFCNEAFRQQLCEEAHPPKRRRTSKDLCSLRNQLICLSTVCSKDLLSTERYQITSESDFVMQATYSFSTACLTYLTSGICCGGRLFIVYMYSNFSFSLC